MFDTCTFHAPTHVHALVTVWIVRLVFLVLQIMLLDGESGRLRSSMVAVDCPRINISVGAVCRICAYAMLLFAHGPWWPVVNKTMTERRTLLQEKFVTIPRRVRSSINDT